MGQLINYPKSRRVPQDVSGWKKTVVPHQSLPLKEIIRRFVRRESLPVEKMGIYVESDYDLEKLAHADVVERHEVLNVVKEDVKRRKKVIDDLKKAEEASRAKGEEKPVNDKPPATDPSGDGDKSK